MRRFFSLLMVFCLPFFFVPPAMAQNNASIVGLVTDPSGAAMPNVKITVANPNQGIERPTVTDSVGAYKVGFLPIGTYTVTAEVAGFQKYVQTDITLQIGQVQRVDLTMQVGTTTQEVTVTGNIVKVQTDESVLSSVVSGTQIQAINLNGRNFVALATLVPGGEVSNSYDPTLVGQSTISYTAFNGTMYYQSDWSADGGNLFNWWANGNFHTTPSLDSIAEFKISTANYTADSGIKLGAVVEMSTKSGTRDFHGDMYEYVRNQMWDANPWFVNRQLHPGSAGANWNAPKTPLKWNDFGFTLGGPFWIPGHYNTDKSKTFFFWSSEWKRVRQGTTLTGQAPTARMRGGDFSECDNTSPNYNSQISGCDVPTDLATGQFYTREGNGLVPVSTQANLLLNTWVPLPNNGPTGWIKSPSVATDWRQRLLRVDQNISDKTRVYVRVNTDRTVFPLVPARYSGSTYDTYETIHDRTEYNWSGHLTHTFTPSIVNDFMFHYDDKAGQYYNVPGPGWTSAVLTKPAGWSMQYLFPANAKMPMLPGFFVSGGGVDFGQDWGFVPDQMVEWNTQFADNLAISHGNHNIKMGVTFINGGAHDTQSGGNNEAEGQLYFDTGSPISTGNALADMQLGGISQYAESSPNDGKGNGVGGYFGTNFYDWRLEPYIQDDWRVTRKLTLNIGLRAMYLVPFQDHSAAFNLKWNGFSSQMIADFYPALYDPTKQAPLNAAGNITRNYTTGQIYDFKQYGNGLVGCGQGSVPAGCQYTNGPHWAPRFGFAYQPFSNPNTVIRGGFGVFYDQSSGNETTPVALTGNSPIYLDGTANNVIGYGAITPAAYGPGSLNMIGSNIPNPMAYEYSLGFQRELKGNNRLGVSYVSTMGRHNARAMSFNRIKVGTNTKNVPALAGTNGCDASGNCDVQSSLINNYHSIDFFRPYQGYTTISERENSATSNYQGLQAELRHPVGHGLTLEAAYTWSKWMTDAASSYGADPNVDDDNLRRYWARSSYDRTQVVSLQYVYDLPFLKNASNHYVKNAIGGWQVTGVTSFFTGLPVNIGCSVSGRHSGTGGSMMCNSLGPMRVQKGIDNNPTYGPIVSWFNPNNVGQLQLSQLSANGQPGMFGWMGINQLTGPGRNNWDLAMLKNFTAPWFKGEHSTVQFRWETYNTFNHPEWQGVSAGCGSTTPLGASCGYQTINGKTYNLGRGDVTSAWPQRIMQFALKFVF